MKYENKMSLRTINSKAYETELHLRSYILLIESLMTTYHILQWDRMSDDVGCHVGCWIWL
jgi:hypothetical protein